MFCVGVHDESPSPIIEDRSRAYRFGNAQAFDRITGIPTTTFHQALPHSPLDNKLQHIYNVIMNSIGFSWDNRKNLANQKKHRVSFEEAQTVFFDEHAIEYDDPDHSESEDRFLMLGHSYRIRVLVVSYTLRKNDTEIRIISARKATKKEQRAYFGEKL